MSWSSTATIAHEDYVRARRRAMLARLWALLRRDTGDLLSFEEVRARVHVRGQHHGGLQAVPLDRIVGSESRYDDFDRSFAPRQDATKFRWLSIAKAYHEAVALPAVELYRLGTIYFVKDGHHRISVARFQGQAAIDAQVTELDIDVPLDASLRAADLPLIEEYADFLEWTELARLRPEQQIRFSEPGGYLALVAHINGHRYFASLDRGHAVGREEAVTSWYDSVYLPVVAALRECQALRAFPGRTEADLYRWVMDHRWYLRERNGGDDPGPAAAIADYVRHYGRHGLVALFGRALTLLRSPLSPQLTQMSGR